MNIEEMKAFLDRVLEFLADRDEGVIGYDDEGITICEWSEDWEGCMEREESTVPWDAFTDPDGYDIRAAERQKQEEAERARQDAEWAAKRARETEAQERHVLRVLLAKYGTPA